MIPLLHLTAKEEARRLTAAPWNTSDLPVLDVGLENHLDYAHRPGGTLSDDEARVCWPESVGPGLAALCNSRLLDIRFRTINGDTQVQMNATELRTMPLPAHEIIVALGRRVKHPANPLRGHLSAEGGEVVFRAGTRLLCVGLLGLALSCASRVVGAEVGVAHPMGVNLVFSNDGLGAWLHHPGVVERSRPASPADAHALVSLACRRGGGDVIEEPLTGVVSFPRLVSLPDVVTPFDLLTDPIDWLLIQFRGPTSTHEPVEVVLDGAQASGVLRTPVAGWRDSRPDHSVTVDAHALLAPLLARRDPLRSGSWTIEIASAALSLATRFTFVTPAADRLALDRFLSHCLPDRAPSSP